MKKKKEVLQNASPYKQTEKDMVSGGAQPEICLCEAKMAFLKGLLQNALHFATVPFYCALNFCFTEFTLFCSACSVGYQPFAAILSYRVSCMHRESFKAVLNA